MKTLPPSLTPFVRSDAVGALLAETLGRPDVEVSLAELGRRTGVSAPVVHREVGRLVESGVLRDRVEGRNRLVRADVDHPLFAPMSQIIAATYGPVPTLQAAFEGVEGVEDVVVYGSWAARRLGEPGEFPRDLDVLVIGTTPRRQLAEIAAHVGERLGIPVHITRSSREDWEASDPSAFVQTVRSRPVVEVIRG
ncbi:MAG: winged helix-turn-helix domain-containing protein [Mobilicoccus sp.]|nr:winged helix-turn-helix domain-containing protein [Mobilicoccus sp.]MDO5629234.1 winged helix-turn-helix domain-containing protein [Mobilicoccus sp.]